jgi:hypothetical protein
MQYRLTIYLTDGTTREVILDDFARARSAQCRLKAAPTYLHRAEDGKAAEVIYPAGTARTVIEPVEEIQPAAPSEFMDVEVTEAGRHWFFRRFGPRGNLTRGGFTL